MHDDLLLVRVIPRNFKTFTNFIIVDFYKLCGLLVLVIDSHAKSTSKVHKLSGRPLKWCPQQRLANFILYMNYDNVTSYDVFKWNWSCSTLSDDVLFISSCINHALA